MCRNMNGYGNYIFVQCTHKIIYLKDILGFGGWLLSVEINVLENIKWIVVVYFQNIYY